MLPIRVYSHYYLNEDSSWVFMFLDHMKMIEDSGLMDALEVIKFTILANQQQAELFKQLVSLYTKVEVYHIDYNFNDNDLAHLNDTASNKYVGEQPTLRRLWEDSFHGDFYALYFHNKGSTAFPNMFKSGKDIPQFKNYHYWRKYLEWGCIEKWEDCLIGLESHDAAGVGFNMRPVPHFSGNFWWTKSDYMKKLDDIADSSWWKNYCENIFGPRMISEFWPLSVASSVYVLHQLPPELCDPNPGLYAVTYHRKFYTIEQGKS